MDSCSRWLALILLRFTLVYSLMSGVFGRFPAPAHAQARAFDCVKKLEVGEGKREVEKVQEAYGKLSTLKAHFSQESYLAALDISERSEGTVTFRKPGLMKWRYEKPQAQTFLVKENIVWFYQPVDNQVTIDKFADILISDVPVAFLMGLGDLARDFELRSGCDVVSGIVLEMVPKKGGREATISSNKSEVGDGEGLRQFFLLTNRDDHLPRGAKVVDIGGNMTSLLLDSLEPQISLEPTEFDPDYPAGVDIIDRRAGDS